MTVFKRWRIVGLGVIVSLLATLFVVRELDLPLLGEALAQARFIAILPCVALLLMGLFTRAIRWRVLLSDALPFWRAFHIMNVAYLVNGVLPLRIGEVARVFLANRVTPPVPMAKTAMTVVVERLLDLLAVVMLVAFALVAGDIPPVLRSAGVVMGIMGLTGFVILVILSGQRPLAYRLVEWVIKFIPPLKRMNPTAILDHLLDGLAPLANIRTLSQALFWTGLSWVFSVIAGYVLMYTFYDNPSWSATCLYIAAAAFAIAVPATIGSLGVYEASIVIALDALGYGNPPTVAIAFAVVVHGVNVLVHSATGAIGFIHEGVSLGQLSRGVRDVQLDSTMTNVPITEGSSNG
ncbi:MAG: lysylphosphatidylglycerol synthase transmembrane domain-containing protein [Phototrophicales bacterium]|nr:lysylphosphatidylglycerol synthase transmembrane domain-containing protein [Phototrophicales bacterium]